MSFLIIDTYSYLGVTTPVGGSQPHPVYSVLYRVLYMVPHFVLAAGLIGNYGKLVGTIVCRGVTSPLPNPSLDVGSPLVGSPPAHQRTPPPPPPPTHHPRWCAVWSPSYKIFLPPPLVGSFHSPGHNNIIQPHPTLSPGVLKISLIISPISHNKRNKNRKEVYFKFYSFHSW